MPLIVRVFVCLIAALLFSACMTTNLPLDTQTDILGTATPFGPGVQPDQEQASLWQSPESVVQAFLTDVQEAPDQIQGYLSRLMQERYPGSEIINELNLGGIIEGFAIRSATSNHIMGLAYVTVGITSADNSFELEFTLIKENNTWVISGMEVFPPE